MDLLDWIVYTVKRLVLAIVIVILACFVGEIAFPALASVVPKGAKGFFISHGARYTTALILCLVLILLVLYKDGKKHTAYEYYNISEFSAAALVLGIIYFIPSIFRDSFASEGRGEIFYKVMYYPYIWANEICKIDFTLAMLVCSLATAVLGILAYGIAHKVYVKKYPDVFE